MDILTAQGAPAPNSSAVAEAPVGQYCGVSATRCFPWSNVACTVDVRTEERTTATITLAGGNAEEIPRRLGYSRRTVRKHCGPPTPSHPRAANLQRGPFPQGAANLQRETTPRLPD